MDFRKANDMLAEISSLDLKIQALELERRTLEREYANEILTCKATRIPTKEERTPMSPERQQYLKLLNVIRKDGKLLERLIERM